MKKSPLLCAKANFSHGSVSVASEKGWYSEPECRTFSELRFYPYLPAQTFDYSLTDGESHACAGVLLSVQPSEDTEDLRRILRIDADSVVGY